MPFPPSIRVLYLITLHNRLDARLLDQMAQPHQHRKAKYRGCADPSHLRGSMSMYVSQDSSMAATRSTCSSPMHHYRGSVKG